MIAELWPICARFHVNYSYVHAIFYNRWNNANPPSAAKSSKGSAKKHKSTKKSTRGTRRRRRRSPTSSGSSSITDSDISDHSMDETRMKKHKKKKACSERAHDRSQAGTATNCKAQVQVASFADRDSDNAWGSLPPFPPGSIRAFISEGKHVANVVSIQWAGRVGEFSVPPKHGLVFLLEIVDAQYQHRSVYPGPNQPVALWQSGHTFWAHVSSLEAMSDVVTGSTCTASPVTQPRGNNLS